MATAYRSNTHQGSYDIEYAATGIEAGPFFFDTELNIFGSGQSGSTFTVDRVIRKEAIPVSFNCDGIIRFPKTLPLFVDGYIGSERIAVGFIETFDIITGEAFTADGYLRKKASFTVDAQIGVKTATLTVDGEVGDRAFFNVDGVVSKFDEITADAKIKQQKKVRADAYVRSDRAIGVDARLKKNINIGFSEGFDIWTPPYFNVDGQIGPANYFSCDGYVRKYKEFTIDGEIKPAAIGSFTTDAHIIRGSLLNVDAVIKKANQFTADGVSERPPRLAMDAFVHGVKRTTCDGIIRKKTDFETDALIKIYKTFRVDAFARDPRRLGIDGRVKSAIEIGRSEQFDIGIGSTISVDGIIAGSANSVCADGFIRTTRLVNVDGILKAGNQISVDGILVGLNVLNVDGILIAGNALPVDGIVRKTGIENPFTADAFIYEDYTDIDLIVDVTTGEGKPFLYERSGGYITAETIFDIAKQSKRIHFTLSLNDAYVALSYDGTDYDAWFKVKKDVIFSIPGTARAIKVKPVSGPVSCQTLSEYISGR